MEELSLLYGDNVRRMDQLLGAGRNCDMVARNFCIGGRRGRIWVIDGYGRDPILERMGAFWLERTERELAGLADMQAFADRFITFSETSVTRDVDQIVTGVLLGKTLLLLEGLAGAALMDAKSYPTRSVKEPADGKVLRGAHDGFVEAVVPNMALLRRRIRDPHLTLEGHKVGSRSHTDVVLCYLSDRVDPALLEEVRGKLAGVEAASLSMGQESLAEALRPRQWYNPFPKIRFTERPDTAAASVLEGSLVLLVDNSPAAMLLPTSLFDFVQEANDFYFPPLVGTYLRLIRLAVFLLSLFVTPVWYLLCAAPGRMPGWLAPLARPDPCALSLLGQLLAVEFLIDVLKLASLNTPDALSNSFSMLGALILGDFAVQAGWLSPQVLVYMAFVSVAGFAQPGYELGYAFKLLRLGLLGLSAAGDVWGFAAGCGGILALLATCKSTAGRGYLYPLIPFDARALRRLLVREPISRHNT
jgi:stage V sporulation protein AF